MTALKKSFNKLTFSTRVFAAALLLALAIGVIGAATSGAQTGYVSAPPAPASITVTRQIVPAHPGHPRS